MGAGPEQTSKGAPRPDSLLGVRHVQVALLCTAMCFCYCLRVNLSVAIVAMVDSSTANPDYPEYDWDLATQSLMLSSFFWGYVVTQIPGGLIAEKFGPKMLLLSTVAGSSILAMLTPIAATWGWQAVCAVRVLQGLIQGSLSPASNFVLANWAPAPERGQLTGYTFSGGTIGTIITLPLSGFLASSSWGWPSTFYVFGVIGLVWSALWFYLGSNTPAEDRFVSSEERAYIEDNTGITLQRNDAQVEYVTPWLSMLTSRHVWAILVAHCGYFWGFWTLLTEMPTFMKNVLHYDIKTNGLLSTLPYLTSWVLGYVFAWISDVIQRRHLVSTITSRKMFTTIAYWVPAVALIVLGYTTTPGIAVSLLVVAVAINSAYMVGFNMNHVDLSPNYAGSLMGITNCTGNFMSIIAPLVAGAIVTDEESAEQWRIVFFIAAGMYLVCNTVFMIFGTADIQPWNEPRLKSKTSSVITLKT